MKNKYADRTSLTRIFMEITKLFAERSTCLRPHDVNGKIGAIIVKEGRIVSTGYTGSASGDVHCIDVGCLIDSHTGGCIRTIHAEQNAIAFAAKYGISIDGGNMYITLSPCLSCAKLIVAAGIKKVIYLEEYRDSRGINYLRDHIIIRKWK